MESSWEFQRIPFGGGRLVIHGPMQSGLDDWLDSRKWRVLSEAGSSRVPRLCSVTLKKVPGRSPSFSSFRPSGLPEQKCEPVALYVTDTHPLLWYAAETYQKLSRRALRAFQQASRGEALIWVPAMAVWEAGILNTHQLICTCLFLQTRRKRVCQESTLAKRMRDRLHFGSAEASQMHQSILKNPRNLKDIDVRFTEIYRRLEYHESIFWWG